MTIGDKVTIINEGMLSLLGDAGEIFDHPANLFVVGFIGNPPMNLIDCTLTEKNGRAHLDAGAFTLTIPDDIRDVIKENASGLELILDIRLENTSLVKKRTPEAIMKAEVYVTEPFGSEIIVAIIIDDNIIKARVAPDF